MSRIRADCVDREKRTIGPRAPGPRGGREIARLDRRQPLVPGPKRVRELFPAASECAARKTRITWAKRMEEMST